MDDSPDIPDPLDPPPAGPAPLSYRSTEDDRRRSRTKRSAGRGGRVVAGAGMTVLLLGASVVGMVLMLNGQPASGSPDVSGVLLPMAVVLGIVAFAAWRLIGGDPDRRPFAVGLLVGLPIFAGLVVLLIGACFFALSGVPIGR